MLFREMNVSCSTISQKQEAILKQKGIRSKRDKVIHEDFDANDSYKVNLKI